jgi:hypothetical protein
LTTPNYASASLTVIENTVLEGIARLQGFSRRELQLEGCCRPNEECGAL